jgi:hypothetical protein
VPLPTTRADLLAIVGAERETSVVAIYRRYLARRHELLAVDPDHRRPEVARLDDAFARLRSAADLEHRLADAQDAGAARAEIRIGVGTATVVVRPAPAGLADGAYPFADVERVHVVAAGNPRSRVLRPHENAGRQRALAGRVAAMGLPTWPATGFDGEAALAVAGLTRAQARALGAAFDQDAVLEWTPTAWWLVPCDELVAPRESGWRGSRIARPARGPLAAPAAPDDEPDATAALAAAEEAEAAAISRAGQVTAPVTSAADVAPAQDGPASPRDETDRQGPPEQSGEPGQRDEAGPCPAAGLRSEAARLDENTQPDESGPRPTGQRGEAGPRPPAGPRGEAGQLGPASHDLPASHGGAGE